MSRIKIGDVFLDGVFDVVVLDVIPEDEEMMRPKSLVLMKKDDYLNRFEDAIDNSEFYYVF